MDGSAHEMELGGPDNRSIRELITDIISNVQQMFRAEIRLARTSSAQAVKAYAVSAVCGLYSGALIMAAIVFLIAYWLPLWLASLIVGVVVGIAAAIFFSMGKRKLERLERSIQDVKEVI
jgi:hypothetical protein